MIPEMYINNQSAILSSNILFHTQPDQIVENFEAAIRKLNSGEKRCLPIAEHDPVNPVNLMMVPHYTDLQGYELRSIGGKVVDGRVKGGFWLVHSEVVGQAINQMWGENAIPMGDKFFQLQLEDFLMSYNEIIREYDDSYKRYKESGNIYHAPMRSPQQLWFLPNSSGNNTLYLRHLGSLINDCPVSFYTLGSFSEEQRIHLLSDLSGRRRNG